MNDQHRSDQRHDRDVAKGEILPAWFPRAQARAGGLVKKFEEEELSRMAEMRPGSPGAVTAAARRAQIIRERIARGETQRSKNNFEFAKVAEVFIAEGFRGKPTDVRGNGGFVPGWFGRLSEITIANDTLDVHENIDFIAKYVFKGQEVGFGIDVTTSSMKLEKKFDGIKEKIRKGAAGMMPDNGTYGVVIPLVIGVSRDRMMELLRHWSKEGEQIDAYAGANAAIGLMIREQIAVQLEEFGKFAERCGAKSAATFCAAALDSLRSSKYPVPEDIKRESDPVHAEILRHARAINAS